MNAQKKLKTYNIVFIILIYIWSTTAPDHVHHYCLSQCVTCLFRFIMAELIQTEKAYVRDLRECMDVSIVPNTQDTHLPPKNANTFAH